MPRYKLTVEYDGSAYCGWQRQPDAPSVQQALEEAVSRFVDAPTDLVVAGRTDAGVHALGQVAHFDCGRELSPRSIVLGINSYLLEHRISVVSGEAVSDDFHARFSALSRCYRYRILHRLGKPAVDFGRVWHLPYPLDVEAMRQAAAVLLGHHDFSSFRSPFCQAKSALRTLDRLDVTAAGDEVRIDTSARSFLHNQVRIMVGTLREVGRGKWTVAGVEAALAARSRAAAGPTAPPHGLCLLSVAYPAK